jgi:hypothetical protein
MAQVGECVLTYENRVMDSEGVSYTATAWGVERSDGTWAGWLEFVPGEGSKPVLRTARETTQARREGLLYWATGVEATYLEGAFARAHSGTAQIPQRAA